MFVGLQTILLSGDRVGGLLAGDSYLRIASELASYNLHRDGLAGLPINGVGGIFHHESAAQFLTCPRSRIRALVEQCAERENN
jgi:dihydroorotate dehydrogenase